ncbi:acyl-CoA--sterol O-acyltransferase 1-like [Carya illinoinensis]|nr:acyl-CoA--sterol O-acyltransferase 1-like [Carya illinoinensis]
MEGEINKFIEVWISVFVCLSYCYAISHIVSKGLIRLLCILPILCVFLFLPLYIHSIHLGSISAFFISWLANFKLLLFAFGQGPLCSDPSISLGRFVSVGCFPIKIQQKTPPKPFIQIPSDTPNQTDSSPPIMSNPNDHNKENPISNKSEDSHVFPIKHAVIGILLAIMIRVYGYSEHIHPKVILLLYCFHIYFLLEIILAEATALAQALLGVELEPQFNEPYFTTSLQDFWGRRWNLMVTNILRMTVYNPTRHAATSVIRRKWAPLPAILTTFLVSGLMHELVFYCMGRLRPTWEVTWFFILHGGCLMVEIVLKKFFSSRWRLPWLISGSLTVGFVIVTSFWLFFPQFLRFKADERAFQEYAALGEFWKNVTRRILQVFLR